MTTPAFTAEAFLRQLRLTAAEQMDIDQDADALLAWLDALAAEVEALRLEVIAAVETGPRTLRNSAS